MLCAAFLVGASRGHAVYVEQPEFTVLHVKSLQDLDRAKECLVAFGKLNRFGVNKLIELGLFNDLEKAKRNATEICNYISDIWNNNAVSICLEYRKNPTAIRKDLTMLKDFATNQGKFDEQLKQLCYILDCMIKWSSKYSEMVHLIGDVSD